MSQTKIKACVMTVAVNQLEDLTDSQIAWPNRLFTPPGGLWVRVSYLPAPTSQKSLGNEGEDELKGILQLDVNTPTNIGDKAQADLLILLESYFVPGRSFTHDSQTVIFTAADRSNGRVVDSNWRVSLSVSFYGRYKRPSIL